MSLAQGDRLGHYEGVSFLGQMSRNFLAPVAPEGETTAVAPVTIRMNRQASLKKRRFEEMR
jgi:hypothetical protein